MTSYLFGLVGSLLTLVLIAELLRRGRLREKYAALWIAVGIVVLVACIFPGLLFSAAEVLGFTVPINLVLFVSALVLLVVSVQLSAEIGRLEEESRTLAEEVALLRLGREHLQERVDRLEQASADVARPGSTGSTGSTGGAGSAGSAGPAQRPGPASSGHTS